MIKPKQRRDTLIINIESSRYIMPKSLARQQLVGKLVVGILVATVGLLMFYLAVRLGE